MFLFDGRPVSHHFPIDLSFGGMFACLQLLNLISDLFSLVVGFRVLIFAVGNPRG